MPHGFYTYDFRQVGGELQGLVNPPSWNPASFERENRHELLSRFPNFPLRVDKREIPVNEVEHSDIGPGYLVSATPFLRFCR